VVANHQSDFRRNASSLDGADHGFGAFWFLRNKKSDPLGSSMFQETAANFHFQIPGKFL
jgi:hypothetical protein